MSNNTNNILDNTPEKLPKSSSPIKGAIYAAALTGALAFSACEGKDDPIPTPEAKDTPTSYTISSEYVSGSTITVPKTMDDEEIKAIMEEKGEVTDPDKGGEGIDNITISGNTLTVSLYGTDPNGKETTKTVSYTINRVDVTASFPNTLPGLEPDNNITVGNTDFFKNLFTQSISLSDGTTAKIDKILVNQIEIDNTHMIYAPGTYTITLQVKDANGNILEKDFSLTVDAKDIEKKDISNYATPAFPDHITNNSKTTHSKLGTRYTRGLAEAICKGDPGVRYSNKAEHGEGREDKRDRLLGLDPAYCSSNPNIGEIVEELLSLDPNTIGIQESNGSETRLENRIYNKNNILIVTGKELRSNLRFIDGGAENVIEVGYCFRNTDDATSSKYPLTHIGDDSKFIDPINRAINDDPSSVNTIKNYITKNLGYFMSETINTDASISRSASDISQIIANVIAIAKAIGKLPANAIKNDVDKYLERFRGTEVYSYIKSCPGTEDDKWWHIGHQLDLKKGGFFDDIVQSTRDGVNTQINNLEFGNEPIKLFKDNISYQGQLECDSYLGIYKDENGVWRFDYDTYIMQGGTDPVNLSSINWILVSDEKKLLPDSFTL